VNSPEVVAALVNVFSLMVPEIILVAGACVLFLGATFRNDRHLWATVALIALAVAGSALVLSPQQAPTRAALYAGALVLDPLAILIKEIALISGAVLVLVSWNEVPDRRSGEYYACLLLIIAGLCLTGAANELVTLFLALELISIPTYILLYLPRDDDAAQEASMKYFLLSIFASALLLFGLSYLYGLGGSTNLPTLLDTLALGGHEGLPGIAQVALVMVEFPDHGCAVPLLCSGRLPGNLHRGGRSDCFHPQSSRLCRPDSLARLCLGASGRGPGPGASGTHAPLHSGRG
jgi:NADH-quinone oxidoreductase subunit N